MPAIKGLEWTFDTVVSAYEKFRPGYVDELYEKIFDYIPIDKCSKAVEVGIGAGQATLPILQTGCSLTAVEYGENFSALCREKFKDYSDFTVITGKFEETIFDNNSVDLVYSASAFHWISEELGYEYVMREDILLCLEYHELNGRQAAALLRSPTPLADIFKDFEKRETDHMADIRDTIESRANTLIKNSDKKKEGR